jgi:hypothetical protein
MPTLQTPCSHYQQTKGLISLARVAGFYEKFGFQLRDPEMPVMNIGNYARFRREPIPGPAAPPPRAPAVRSAISPSPG